MEKLIGKIAAVCFAAVIVFFAAYQAVRFLQSPYKTQTAFGYTYQDSINAQGIMIRDETVIDDVVSGTPSYYTEDGARVSEGDPVVKLHPDMQSAANEKRYNEIQRQINSLKEIQNYSGTSALKAEGLNRYINELLSSMSLATFSNVYGDIDADSGEDNGGIKQKADSRRRSKRLRTEDRRARKRARLIIVCRR